MNPCHAHGCAECCHDTEMPLTEEDASRLEALGFARASFSFVTEEGMMQLRTKDEPRADGKRPCFFLEKNECSVYAARPTGCRVYPFVQTLDGIMARDEDCPWSAEFFPEPGTQRKLARVVLTVKREADARRGN
jgi:uncharacterized protein